MQISLTLLYVMYTLPLGLHHVCFWCRTHTRAHPSHDCASYKETSILYIHTHILQSSIPSYRHAWSNPLLWASEDVARCPSSCAVTFWGAFARAMQERSAEKQSRPMLTVPFYAQSCLPNWGLRLPPPDLPQRPAPSLHTNSKQQL